MTEMTWQKILPGQLFFEGGDPYFQLRTGAECPAGFASRCPSELRPALIRLNNTSAADFAEQPGGAAESQVYVSALYTHPSDDLGRTTYCTALVNREFIESVNSNKSIARITVLPAIDGDLVPASFSHQHQPRHIPAAKGEPEAGTVVIGIIDYGIAFAHERFRLAESRTRIEYLWVQDAPFGQDMASYGPGLHEAPPKFQDENPDVSVRNVPVDVNPIPYGREISRGDIDRLLSDSARGRFVDEDELYRRAGADLLGRRWLRSISTRTAHGTHVMDVACGYALNEEDEKLREQRPIVCVQLPEATTADTSGENLDAYAFDGMRYILDRADAIARGRGCGPLPVVINFSYGNVAGPHDGTSDLEAAIDDLVLKRNETAPLEVVLPAGNSHLARLHAQITFPDVAPDDPGKIEAVRTGPNKGADYLADLHWRVQPDDSTPSFLEIWLPPLGEGTAEESPAGATEDNPAGPPNGGSRIKLGITPPGGPPSTRWLDESQPGSGIQYKSGNDVLCEARYRYIRPPTDRGMFLVALQPTKRNEPARPGAAANAIAPSGTWIVTLVNTGLGEDEPVQAWIQRDDTPYGFRRRGRQSYFDDERYKRFDAQGREIEGDTEEPACHVKRAGSINAIATGRETIVVGGYLGDIRPANYSAGGPITRAAESPTVHRYGPDLMAVSDDSIAHRGVLAAGTRSGSVVAQNGTSVAAPQITWEIAKRLAEWTPGLASPLTLQLAQARPAASSQPKPSRERVGAGRVETERPPGVSTRGARRFDQSDRADGGGSAWAIGRHPRSAAATWGKGPGDSG